MKYKIIIQRVVKENYEMVLEGEDTMTALDQAREMVKTRNATSTSGVYSVIKIDDIKEST
jgi:hypothetical protein